ncbi:glycosyltransferase family 4 protein [Halomontanus rarus]|uniref:glycosyltransferase family 4 protein n=1 Tax=Halomontanus rarus TaxID=3034020 RepID=UPI0023E7D9C2|nr:glycosyltransferase family 4 protein [Halovivax sp. TS33]
MSDELPGVCVVTHPLGSAGENATRTLLEILGDLTDVSLITADLPSTSAIRDRHEVVELTSKGAGQSTVAVAALRFALNQLRMCREIARRDEDVVLFFGATSYLLPVLFARAIGKTVVVEPRGDVPLTLRLNWEQQLPSPLARALATPVRWLEWASYAAANAIVTYTPGMASELGLERFSHKLYPNGARYVDTDRFRPTVPFEERSNTVGFVGRLDEEKGIRELAEVAKQLPDEITFRFVGDGPLRGWLEEELADEIDRGTVDVTGWVDHDDVPAELNRLRLLVMPSQPTEGLPTTILEAMACGTPVYATPVSGVPDVVKEGETGFLMDQTELRVLSERIRSVLEQDRYTPERMSGSSRELVEQEFSFRASLGRYENILADLE